MWDYLSWANKRVLVLGVPFLYPAPKVNGVFVTGRFVPKISCYPETIITNYDLSGFEYEDLPTEQNIERIVSEGYEPISIRMISDLKRRIATTTKMMDSENWDAVIIVDSLPDDLLHISYGNFEIVDQMFEQLDQLLGAMLTRMEKEDRLLIVSDHGFRGVEKLLFMNEWLRSKGYVNSSETLVSRILMSLGVNWDSLSDSTSSASKVYKFVLLHFPWLLDKSKESLRKSMVIDEASQLRTSKVTALNINEPVAWIRISEKHEPEISQESLVSQLQELGQKAF